MVDPCPCHDIRPEDLSETFNVGDVEILQKYYPVLEEQPEEKDKEKEEIEEEEEIHPPSPELDTTIVLSVVLGSVALLSGSIFAYARLRKGGSILRYARFRKRAYQNAV